MTVRKVADVYLLDTSAMIAYLEDEEGADRVEELLRMERTLLPFVTALEVHYVAVQERGATVAEERLASLKALPSLWLNAVDEKPRFWPLLGSKLPIASPSRTPWWPGSR